MDAKKNKKWPTLPNSPSWLRRGVLVLGVAAVLPACELYLTESNRTDTDYDGDGLSNRLEAQLGTQAWSIDSDGDGLYDDEEYWDQGTDPLDPDTDRDGLTDGDEVFVYFTDPVYPDTDGDGISDGAEVRRGLDPLRYDRPGRF